MKIIVRHESWPLRAPFRTSNATFHTSELIVVEILGGDGARGSGEAAGVDYRGETIATMRQEIDALALAPFTSRADLLALLPAGGARNALDSALWDIEAKRSGRRVWQCAGIDQFRTLDTFVTLGMASPAAMARAATTCRAKAIKIKLGDGEDEERLAAVRAARPDVRLIVDANQAWTGSRLGELLPRLHAAGVELIEQPLPAGNDAALAEYDGSIPLCADESLQTPADLCDLVGKYGIVNIKLDKCGGLTSALALAEQASTMGFELMVGCNDATSLGIAPATIVGQRCRFVDLDWHLLNQSDRPGGFPADAAQLPAFPALLWG